MANFFSKLWKNKEKDRFDPQPNSSIQTKAQKLLYMEREFIAQHIKEDDSGLEHLIASLQPSKYSEDYLKHSMDFTIAWWDLEAVEALEERLQKYSTPTELDYEELGGMSDPGLRDCS